MPVDTKHPKFKEQECRWKIVGDAIKGEDHVKDKKGEYLPAPPSMGGQTGWSRSNKDSAGGTTAYDFYQSFAEFPEIVADVLSGFQGLIHSKPPTIVLPKDLEYLLKDATPSGDSLNALWQTVTKMILSGGRVCLLADIAEDGQFRIAAYSADSFINWNEFRPKDGGGLSFAVLSEQSCEGEPDDKFEHVEVERLLELFIETIDGKKEYFHRWWTKKDGSTAQSKWIPDVPTRVELKGKPIDHIPLKIINSGDAGTDYGHIALYGMSKRAFSIYRKTADYNRSLYTKSDPQIVISGASDGEAPTQIGGASIWMFVNPAATAKYLDIDGQGIPLQRQSIVDEFSRFHEEGGKLIHSEGGAGESGEALQTRSNSNQVTLKSVAVNAAKHVQAVLRDIATMLKMPESEVDKITFSPDLDFAQPTLTGQELLNFTQAKNQAAPISNQTLHAIMHRGGVTELPFEKEMKMVEAERVEAEKHALKANAQTPTPDDGESVNKTDEEKKIEADAKKKAEDEKKVKS